MKRISAVSGFCLGAANIFPDVQNRKNYQCVKNIEGQRHHQPAAGQSSRQLPAALARRIVKTPANRRSNHIFIKQVFTWPPGAACMHAAIKSTKRVQKMKKQIKMDSRLPEVKQKQHSSKSHLQLPTYTHTARDSARVLATARSAHTKADWVWLRKNNPKARRKNLYYKHSTLRKLHSDAVRTHGNTISVEYQGFPGCESEPYDVRLNLIHFVNKLSKS